ncbi:MAG TPA: 5-(carboxyamino)imidazole ribonucleotide mutase [Planctomycetes bacterium]|nr:5-(carboxyamino)imidazole ribonucleotide mutase [Planctomycetota bacterium]HIL38597.1 5-(carboxyamino)imidazole ribonucleotide mutase [Planctomycetota bacterium]
MSVALLMGSDSDLPRLESCLETLRGLKIPVEARVMSAHRTPDDVVTFVAEAPKRGIKVFICAAGGAAHLAGVVAAHTSLPVLGIPMDNPPLGGLDALLATVQMPGGVPVATFGANSGGPVNAALFAARLLAISDSDLAQRVEDHREQQKESVRAKDARLQSKL